MRASNRVESEPTSSIARRLSAWLATRTPSSLALGYLVAITVAELLTALVEPQVGLLSHGLILVGLVLHAARVGDAPMQRLLLTIAFAPLIRLLSLSLPLAGIPVIYWYLVTSVPLFAATLVAARSLSFSPRSIGLTFGFLPWQLPIALTGLAFGYVEHAILQPQPLTRSLTLGDLWIPALILLVSTGFLEELVFRGLIQRAAVDLLGSPGILYVAALFAALHVGYRSVVDVVFVFCVGLFLGWAVSKTGTLTGVTIAHGLTNVVVFLVAPFIPLASPLVSAQPIEGSLRPQVSVVMAPLTAPTLSIVFQISDTPILAQANRPDNAPLEREVGKGRSN